MFLFIIRNKLIIRASSIKSKNDIWEIAREVTKYADRTGNKVFIIIKFDGKRDPRKIYCKPHTKQGKLVRTIAQGL